MERRSNRPRNIVDMFGGVQPSKGAAELARKAISLGEDPTALTQQAGFAAQKGGRSKAGFFGEAGPYLNNLKEIVGSIENRRAMGESARRLANRKAF